jgi:hypothetical protein
MALQINLATRCGRHGNETANLKHSGAIRRVHRSAANGWSSFAAGTQSFTAPVTGAEALRLQRRRRFGSFANGMIYPYLPGPRLLLSFIVGSTQGQWQTGSIRGMRILSLYPGRPGCTSMRSSRKCVRWNEIASGVSKSPGGFSIPW